MPVAPAPERAPGVRTRGPWPEPRLLAAPERNRRMVDEPNLLPTLAPAPLRLSEARSRLLRELLTARATGRTADELATALAISRNAVQQQLSALEREGLVGVHELRSTGGRPSRAYTLTDHGIELFLGIMRMAESLLRHTQELFGEEGLQRARSDGGPAEVAPRLQGKAGEERCAGGEHPRRVGLRRLPRRRRQRARPELRVPSDRPNVRRGVPVRRHGAQEPWAATDHLPACDGRASCVFAPTGGKQTQITVQRHRSVKPRGNERAT